MLKVKMCKTNKSLIRLIAKQSKENSRVALDSVFKYILLFIFNQKFLKINNLLKDIDPALFPTNVALGFLTSTYVTRTQYSNRPALLKRTREYFEQKYPPDEVKQLLKGLE